MSAQVLGFLRNWAPLPLAAPRDLAAAGNDAGAPTASARGGEGEPYNQSRDARLGCTDKELKAGAAANDSAPTALGTPWQRKAWVEVMDPAESPPSPLGRIPNPCRVLVLLNPRGGKGKALQLFRSHVQPLLTQADVSFTLMLTEHRNHARELVRVEELGRWDVLVVMSGDGLMHEVVNGLMERPDWETAIRKPLCSLPAGSANAIAASVNHYSGYQQVTNEELLTNCTLLLCRRLLVPMNLLSLHTASGLRLFSVLSLAWGFIADVDLESEKYRLLGEIRFTLGTFLRLASLRTYQGRLAYLPAGGAISRMSTSPPLDHRGPVNSLLVPLDQPVPTNWTVVPEQDFILVLVLLHSHLGSDMFAAPMNRCEAGVMHLFYMRAGVSRATLLRLFLAMEKGRHMDYNCPYLVYMPVVAFRLEPKDGGGVFTVDGELMASEAVQGQVHPDYCRLVSGCSETLPSQQPPPPPEPQESL
ncbi:PREDICTED: sphingosine kinase 1 [Chrysochloris asiatica]|uniref:Sphingosine kinase 1 n=1 Tax=Chrysochloris asiatica TaxID=185453 RepID=A0A9B0TSQ0_CHRAS|nr:PREDICTED: sphingosine kinase 1 [Chrysochloris asiatica]